MIIARLCCFVCDLPAFAQDRGILMMSAMACYLAAWEKTSIPPTMIKQLLGLV